MPDEVVTFRVVGSQAAIDDFKRTAQAVQGITVETAKAGAALRTNTQTLGEARQGFLVLTQTVARASSILTLFGVEASGVDRALSTATAAMATATQAARVFQGGLTGLLATIGPITLALTGLSLGLTKFAADMRGAGVSLWEVIRAGTVYEAQQRRIAQLAGDTSSAEDIVAANTWEHARAVQEAAIRTGIFVRNAEDAARAARELAAEHKQAAAEAKRHADELKRLAAAAAEKAFQLEADAIVAFNIWQREQWEKAAKARTDITLAESERLKTERERLEREGLDLITLANQQAIDAIEQQERDRLETTRQVLAEILRLEEETADLIRLANQQTIDAIEREERERIAAGEKAIAAVLGSYQELANKLRPIGDAVATFFGDLVRGAKTFAESVASFFENMGNAILNLVQRLISSAAVSFLLSLITGKPFSFFFGSIVPIAQGGIVQGFQPVAAFQGGGIVSRPTLAMVGEGGGPEAIVPLRGGAIPVQFQGQQSSLAERISVYVVFDPRQIPPPSPGETIRTVAADIKAGGMLAREIRAAVR